MSISVIAASARSDPNYYKLLVMDNVLGTGSGFTDRLSANLRDRQGLAYTVNASITGDAGEEPGTFTCFIGTFPDKLAAVKDGCLKEIEADCGRNRLQLRKWRREEILARQFALSIHDIRVGCGTVIADRAVWIGI